MYFTADVGGTRIRWAYAKDKVSNRPPSALTPQSYADAIKFFSRRRLEGPKKISGAAFGIPGNLDLNKSRLLRSPHLPHWEGKPLLSDLRKIFGPRTVVENDAALVGLGEAAKGAGKGYGIVAYVTISTGVNGVRVVDGRIDRNALGYEIGRHIVTVLGRTVYTWEQMVSGGAIEKRTGQKPETVKDKSLWLEVERYIAYGLDTLIRFWSPDIIVLGGGVALSEKLSIHRIRSQVISLTEDYRVHPSIEFAALGDASGLQGGIELLRTHT